MAICAPLIKAQLAAPEIPPSLRKPPFQQVTTVFADRKNTQNALLLLDVTLHPAFPPLSQKERSVIGFSCLNLTAHY